MYNPWPLIILIISLCLIAISLQLPTGHAGPGHTVAGVVQVDHQPWSTVTADEVHAAQSELREVTPMTGFVLAKVIRVQTGMNTGDTCAALAECWAAAVVYVTDTGAKLREHFINAYGQNYAYFAQCIQRGAVIAIDAVSLNRDSDTHNITTPAAVRLLRPNACSG